MYADELALLANAPDVTLQEKRYARDVTRGNCSSYVRYIRPTLCAYVLVSMLMERSRTFTALRYLCCEHLAHHTETPDVCHAMPSFMRLRVLHLMSCKPCLKLLTGLQSMHAPNTLPSTLQNQSWSISTQSTVLRCLYLSQQGLL